jgi:hypothetical protein
MGRLERKLGKTALDPSELPVCLGQFGWLQSISHKIAAKPAVVAEVGNRKGWVRCLLKDYR